MRPERSDVLTAQRRVDVKTNCFTKMQYLSAESLLGIQKGKWFPCYDVYRFWGLCFAQYDCIPELHTHTYCRYCQPSDGVSPLLFYNSKRFELLNTELCYWLFLTVPPKTNHRRKWSLLSILSVYWKLCSPVGSLFLMADAKSVTYHIWNYVNCSRWGLICLTRILFGLSGRQLWEAELRSFISAEVWRKHN